MAGLRLATNTELMSGKLQFLQVSLEAGAKGHVFSALCLVELRLLVTPWCTVTPWVAHFFPGYVQECHSEVFLVSSYMAITACL